MYFLSDILQLHCWIKLNVVSNSTMSCARGTYSKWILLCTSQSGKIFAFICSIFINFETDEFMKLLDRVPGLHELHGCASWCWNFGTVRGQSLSLAGIQMHSYEAIRYIHQNRFHPPKNSGQPHSSSITLRE